MRTTAQQQAVDSSAPKIICVAGPGSGKTTVLVDRIQRLVNDGVDPAAIVALTFTNAAAEELARRLVVCQGCGGRGWHVGADRFGEPEQLQCECHSMDHVALRLGYLGTLHGFALKMLRAHGTALGYGARLGIIDAEGSADLIAAKARQMGYKKKVDVILKVKDEKPDPKRLTLEQLILKSYRDDLREAGLIDFDLILSEFLRLLQMEIAEDSTAAEELQKQFTHLFVDEVQDSSAEDWKIYDALKMDAKFFVGDPDQAIYGFRGGSVENMVARCAWLPEKYEVIPLQENFRSHEEICKAANALITNNAMRTPKQTISAKGAGGSVMAIAVHSDTHEVHEVGDLIRTRLEYPGGSGMQPTPLTQMAILGRTRAVVAGFVDGLRAAGIPVAAPGRADLPRDWSFARSFVEWMAQPNNDLLAYFFLIQRGKKQGQTDLEARSAAHEYRREAQAQGKTINQLWFDLPKCDPVILPMFEEKAGVSAESRAIIAGLIQQLPAGGDLLELALAMQLHQPGGTPATEGVECLTIHGAKGREWDVVFLVGFEDEVIPGKRGDPEEERRLAYVALTRARQAVYITCAKNRTTPWGAVEPRTPSRYVKEMLS
jgi:DNA helicase-2/ATP-dependent DNA helicase PcrA